MCSSEIGTSAWDCPLQNEKFASQGALVFLYESKCQ